MVTGGDWLEALRRRQSAFADNFEAYGAVVEGRVDSAAPGEVMWSGESSLPAGNPIKGRATPKGKTLGAGARFKVLCQCHAGGAGAHNLTSRAFCRTVTTVYQLASRPVKVDGRERTHTWKDRGRMKYPPDLLHGVDVPVLQEDEEPQSSYRSDRWYLPGGAASAQHHFGPARAQPGRASRAHWRCIGGAVTT